MSSSMHTIGSSSRIGLPKGYWSLLKLLIVSNLRRIKDELCLGGKGGMPNALVFVFAFIKGLSLC